MQGLNLKIKGLFSNQNQLSEVPEGALEIADNIVINAPSVASSRRGFDVLEHPFSGDLSRAHKLTSYQDKIIANYDTNKLAYYDAAIGWVVYSGTYQAPNVDNEKMKFMNANSNLYFTSTVGVQRLDAVGNTPALAGMFKALDALVSLSGVSGFMDDDSQVAYRYVWGIKDANNKNIVGAPSQRVVITNSSGNAANVDHSVTIPAGITTAHFLQVYRSSLSASETTEPKDDCGLVYEANPTSGQISAKILTFTDSTPDSLRGASLYTNSSQETITQANEPPPFCKDLCVFKGSAFYANTRSKQRLFLSILGVGGSNGVQDGDVLTINGVAYTCRDSGSGGEDTATGHFLEAAGGTPAQNIADTAQSLVRVINRYASNTGVYAYYLSGVGDLPGKLLIEERTYGGSAFAAIASAHGTAYSPALPTSGTSVSSTADTLRNGVYISKTDQPDAVPLTNVLFCGEAGDDIVRILALENSVFVLKRQEGIFRITGTDPSNFEREPFDTTTNIIAPESAVVLNNQIWCLSDQGVVAISETGIEIKSIDIEDILLELFGSSREAIENHAFGVSYETDRKYILWLPSSSANTYATQAFVYSTLTNGWVRWTRSQTCGLVSPSDDLLYCGQAETNYLNVERKTFSTADFVDEAYQLTLISADEDVLTFDSVEGLSEGDVIYESNLVRSVVLEIDVATNEVVVADVLEWTPGAVTVLTAIECVIRWVPYTAGNPGIQKHLSEINIFFKTTRFEEAFIGFSSELSVTMEYVPFEGAGLGAWGRFAWGRSAWGGVKLPRPYRTLVPLEKQRCSQLNIEFYCRSGYGQFLLNGISVRFDPMSEAVAR